MNRLWKLRAEPWVALDGPRKGRLEAITLWASRDGQNPGLFLQNNAELPTLLSQLLSSPELSDHLLSTLAQNKPIDLHGDFTTAQLRSLGFEIKKDHSKSGFTKSDRTTHRLCNFSQLAARV